MYSGYVKIDSIFHAIKDDACQEEGRFLLKQEETTYAFSPELRSEAT